MKPFDLYNREPVRVDTDLSVFFGCYYNHMPECDLENRHTIDSSKNSRIEIHYWKDFWYDSRRCWRLSGAYLDGEPFMIMQNAGREGDDYHARFITNADLYRQAVKYATGLLLPRIHDEIPDTVDPTSDIPSLSTFYGDSLGRHLIT